VKSFGRKIAEDPLILGQLRGALHKRKL